MLLLEAWRAVEEAAAATASGRGDVSLVDSKMPRKLKMRRMATASDGTELGFEDYYDYQFPDDEKAIGAHDDDDDDNDVNDDNDVGAGEEMIFFNFSIDGIIF